MTLRITICQGERCAMRGAADLLRVIKKLPAEQRSQIDFKVQKCFSKCEIDPETHCPCVKINDDDWLYVCREDGLKARLKELLKN